MPEHDVLVVEVLGGADCDEELGGVCVFADVGHAELERVYVRMVEVLVGEELTVDGLPSCTIMINNVPCL